jgi:hypothetical protein
LRPNLFGVPKIAQTNPYRTIALLRTKGHSLSQLEGVAVNSSHEDGGALPV